MVLSENDERQIDSESSYYSDLTTLEVHKTTPEDSRATFQKSFLQKQLIIVKNLIGISDIGLYRKMSAL